MKVIPDSKHTQLYRVLMGNLDPCTQNFSSYIILFMYPHNNLDKEETDEVNVSVGLCAGLTFQTLIAPIFKLLITTTTLYKRLEMRYNASLLRSRILLFCLTGWKSGARLHPRPARTLRRVVNFRCRRFVCSTRSTRIISSIARLQTTIIGSRSLMLCYYRS